MTAVCFEPVLGWICGEPVTPSMLKGHPTTDGPWGIVYSSGCVRDPSLGWFDDPVKWGQRRRRHRVRHRRRRDHGRARDHHDRREQTATEMLLERELRTHGEALSRYDRGEANGFCLVLE